MHAGAPGTSRRSLPPRATSARSQWLIRRVSADSSLRSSSGPLSKESLPKDPLSKESSISPLPMRIRIHLHCVWLLLTFLFRGKALLKPVGIEIIGLRQHPQVGESHRVQRRKCRPHIRTFVERAAPTVNHQIRPARQLFRPLLDLRYPRFCRSRSMKHCPCNMPSGVQRPKSHVQNRWSTGRLFCDFARQFPRLHNISVTPRLIYRRRRRNRRLRQIVIRAKRSTHRQNEAQETPCAACRNSCKSHENSPHSILAPKLIPPIVQASSRSSPFSSSPPWLRKSRGCPGPSFHTNL